VELSGSPDVSINANPILAGLVMFFSVGNLFVTTDFSGIWMHQPILEKVALVVRDKLCKPVATLFGTTEKKVLAIRSKCKTRMAFHQRRYVAVFCPTNEISFPMTGDGAVLDLCRTFSDRDGICNFTVRVFKDTSVPRAADAALGSQSASRNIHFSTASPQTRIFTNAQ
jgi:hypothetical protein